MVPILLLSVLLYERCCNLLLRLIGMRRRVREQELAGKLALERVRRLLFELPEMYRRQRILIGAMIATEPILGLLGTVMGMITTFESLAARTDARSMEGLAAGISQALITTETGLAVIIPAMLVLYIAYRQLQRGLSQLVRIEANLAEAG